jgi:predicted RND superfamily exporter protein
MREMQAIRQSGARLFPEAMVVTTGTLAQFTVMMEYIAWGQIKSYLIALVVIAGMCSVAFKSVKIGLVAMIPNVAPGCFVGGIMGFFGIPLDIMTVTIMPMLLGLAVDDTIHFISHCNAIFYRTGSYAESVRRTFQVVGKAIFITSGILVVGFGAYLLSPILVFDHIAYLVAAGTLAALLADYFITPVLLNCIQAFGPEKRESTVHYE